MFLPPARKVLHRARWNVDWHSSRCLMDTFCSSRLNCVYLFGERMPCLCKVVGEMSTVLSS